MSRNLLQTKPTTAAEPTSVAGGAATLVSADAWFSAGARKPYDPVTKSMLADSTDDFALHVFERVVTGAGRISTSTPWATFLPGFPDGSYGYSRVNDLLGDRVTPRLFVEYLGQGDSDKAVNGHRGRPTGGRRGIHQTKRAQLIVQGVHLTRLLNERCGDLIRVLLSAEPARTGRSVGRRRRAAPTQAWRRHNRRSSRLARRAAARTESGASR